MTSNSDDEKTDETKELMEKISKNTKLLKLVLAKLEEIDKKIDAVATAKPDDEKAKVERIFEKKGIGRPAGSYEIKQEQYVKMLKDGKIKQPKLETLQYYKIIKVGDKYIIE